MFIYLAIYWYMDGCTKIIQYNQNNGKWTIWNIHLLLILQYNLANDKQRYNICKNHKHIYIYILTDVKIDRLIDWLIDRLIDRLIDW